MKTLILFLVISSCSHAQQCPQGFDVVNGKCRSPKVSRDNSLPQANAYDYVLIKRGQRDADKSKKTNKRKVIRSNNLR